MSFERLAPEQFDTIPGIAEPAENPLLVGHDKKNVRSLLLRLFLSVPALQISYSAAAATADTTLAPTVQVVLQQCQPLMDIGHDSAPAHAASEWSISLRHSAKVNFHLFFFFPI